MNSNIENGGKPQRVRITIPGNATASGASIASLAAEAGLPILPGASIRISGNAPGATGGARAAFVVASPRPGAAECVDSDFTTHGEPIPDGMEFYDASTASGESRVRSTTTADVPALLVILP